MSNYYKIVGTITECPNVRYHAFDRDFYAIDVCAERLSGKTDTVTCLIPDGLTQEVKVGQRIGVIGELRSRNGRDGERQKIVVELFSNAVFYDVEHMQDMNTVSYSGRVVKKHFKYTKNGTPMCVCVLVKDREGVDRPDAIPCVFFEANALDMWEVDTHTEVEVKGRAVCRTVGSSTCSDTWKVHEVYVSEHEIKSKAK